MKKVGIIFPFLVLSCFVIIICFPYHADADKYVCVDPLQKNKPRMISNPKECLSPNALITITDAELAKLKEELSMQKPVQKKGTRPTMSRSRTVCKTFCGILNCCITYCCDPDGYCWIADSHCPPRLDK
jgi:hypothetical protein